MYLETDKGETIELQNTSMPKFGGRGRSWDSVAEVEIEGERTVVWADTTWGMYAYFSPGYYSGETNEETGEWEWQDNNPRKRVWYKYDVFETDKLRGKRAAELKRGKPTEEDLQ